MSMFDDFPSKPDEGLNQVPNYGQAPYRGQTAYWGQGPWGQGPYGGQYSYWGSADPFWPTQPKKKHKGFLRKLGNAFCKALPNILITVTSAVVGAIFAQTPSVKARKLA